MIKKTLVIPLFLLLYTPGTHARLRISNETEFGSGSITGPGAGQSIVTGKGTFTNVLGISYSGEVQDVSYFLDLSGRATSDPASDYREYSLSRVQARVIKEAHTVNLGDVMSPFTQYSLGASLKGITYTGSYPGRFAPELSLTYGFHSPRWDSLFSPADDIKTIRRQAYGANLAVHPTDAWRVSAHFVRTADSGRPGGWETLYDGGVYGAAWSFEPFDGLALRGETSFSGTTVRPADGSSVKKSGSANRVSFRGYGDDLRLDLDYERVSSGFLSVLGSATPDRERARGVWTRDYSRETSVRYSFLWFRNNLDGSLEETSHSYRPDIRITQRRLFGRRYASGDITCRLDYRTGPSRDTGTYVDTGYRDRFGWLDSETRLGVAFFGGDIRDSAEYVVNTSLGSRKSLKGLILRPNLRIGTRIHDDSSTGTLDIIREASLGSGVDVPGLGLSCSVQGGVYSFKKDNGSDSSRAFISAHSFYRPRFGDYTVFLRYSLNDFRSSDSGRDYRENLLSAGISIQY